MEKNKKNKIECGVCWGEGKIEYDDYGNEMDCPLCKGTGFIIKKQQGIIKLRLK